MISFAVSLGVTITGIGYQHDSRWVRGFLALGLLLAELDLLRVEDH